MASESAGRRRAAWVVMVATGLGLCACGERAEPAAAVAASAAPPAGVTVRARIQAAGPEMAYTLVVDPHAAAGADLNVRAIEIRRAGSADVIQRIDGLSTRTPSSAEAPGLEVLDLDFDDHADIRLIESQPAGPDVPYLHWLYQPATGQYVAAPALDALGAPQPDAPHRELRVDWRDGAARSGSDFYAWQAGRPLRVRQEVRQYTQAGVYTLTVSVPEHGGWRVLRTEKRREP